MTGPASKASKLVVALLTAAFVASSVGEDVSMPLVFTTLPPNAGPFTIIFMCGALFTVVFMCLAIQQWMQGHVTPGMIACLKSRKHFAIFLMGFFNAVNGLISVYTSPPTRVPPDLQPVLSQSSIPYVLIFSRIFLRKRYHWLQFLGTLLVMGGMLVSIVPTLSELADHDNTEFQSGAWWALVLVLGMMPGVLTTVLQEKFFTEFPEFNVPLLLALVGFYQFASVASMFWLDFTPNFGLSPDIETWRSGFVDGFKCSFTPSSVEDLNPNCKYASAMVILSVTSISGDLIFSALLYRVTSANYAALVSSLGNPLAVTFWMIFPSVNAWVSGPAYTSTDLAYAAGSLPLILVGVYLFHRKEPETKRRIGNASQPSLLEVDPMDDSLLLFP